MFNFAPPAKVARTQRSSVSQASIQHHHHDLVASSVTSRQSHVPPSVSQRTIEFPENPTAVLRQQQLVAAGGRGGSRPIIAGIGARVAWQVDDVSVQLWTIDSNTGSLKGPALFPTPTFDVTTDNRPANVAAFAAEWEAEETILLCSKSGVVRSLDARIEFQFDSEDVSIEISAFAVLGGNERGGSSCFVVAGTTSGLVLSYNIQSTEEDAGVLDTRSYLLNTPQALTASTSTGWLSWLTGGGRASTSQQQQRKQPQSLNSSAPLGVERLFISSTNPNHLWIVQGGQQVLLVDIAAGVTEFQILFAVDLESSIGAKGSVLGIDSIVDGALLVYRYFDARSEKESLALVTLSSKNGSVSTVTALSGLGSLLPTTTTTRHHHGSPVVVVALSSRAQQGHEVTIVFGSCAIRVNNAAGVRHPCTSEDVTVLTRQDGTVISEAHLLAAKVVCNQQQQQSDVVLLDTHSGPFFASPDGSRSVVGANRSGEALMSPTFNGVGNVGGSIHMSQRIAGILSASRVDARATLDEIVLNVVDEILQNTPLHAANWARVDLHSEDINLFTHVTRHLVVRQEEHRALMKELFTRHYDSTWSKLSQPVVASLVSIQEQLRCLVEIRRIQNDIRSINEETVTSLITTLAAPQQQQQLSVKQTASIVSSAAEEHSQELLRRAVVDVAEYLRAEALSSGGPAGALPSTASSAEITFGKAENICTILRRLNTIVSESWLVHTAAAGGPSYVVEVENRVRVTLAASFVFASIIGQIRSGRSSLSSTQHGGSSVRRAGVEEIERDDVAIVVGPGTFGIASQQAADAVLVEVAQSLLIQPSGKDALWTSGVTGGATGLEAALLDQAMLLSDALSVLSNNAITTGGGGTITGNSRTGLAALQQSVLDMLSVVMDSLLTFSSSATFSSELIRRALLRSPFVSQNIGFPFGSPSAADNHSLGTSSNTAIRKAILQVAERFALQYGLYDIMFLFAAGDYHPDPESALPAGSHFATMRKYVASTNEQQGGGNNNTVSSSEFLFYCIEALASQDREPEILALPALLADSSSSSSSDIQSIRDELLRQYLPHLHWQADPSAFYSLREEGAQGNPNVSYGATALEHRSRCLSMAKLAWIANGAPLSGHYEDVVTDELIVESQRAYLSDPAVMSTCGYGPNEVLTTTEAVHHLVSVASSSSASTTGGGSPQQHRYWELAAAIASRTPLPLRGELYALVLREALAKDGVEMLLKIPSDAVSERELLARFDATLTGRVLLSSPPLKTNYEELGTTIQRALSMLARSRNATTDDDDARGERLVVTLINWISLRATSGI